MKGKFFKDGIGRKFVAFLYVQTGLFLLLGLGKLPSNNFEFLTMITIGALIGGNLGERVIEAKKPTP